MAPLPPTIKDNSFCRRQRRRLLLVMLLVVAAASAALGSFAWARHHARQEREEGVRAAHSGRFADAEPLLRRTLERTPDDLDALRALALGYLGCGQLEEAEHHLSRWCALRPGDAEPFKHRMEERHRRSRTAPNAAEQQRLMREAVADGRQALQLDPDDDPVAQEVV